MTNIVYLFGAGASAGALPIINQIPERLNAFIKTITSNTFELAIEEIEDFAFPDYNLAKAQRLLIDDLKWLLTNSSNHASIDTFAKKLFLLDDLKNLKRLKLALSIFFIYEQVSNKPDPRYDTFFASILKTHLSSFPQNIQIISWNYDYQFELAYSFFSNSTKLGDNETKLNVKEKHQNNVYDKRLFTIYKLNGTTRLNNKNNPYSNINFINNFSIPFDKDFFTKLVKTHFRARQSPSTDCALSFSWETEANGWSLIDGLIKNIDQTEVLVVVGYSFPFFNRDTDRKIMKAMPLLKKVYLQSIEPEAIKERFSAVYDNMNRLEFVLKKDVSQFFLPNEL